MATKTQRVPLVAVAATVVLVDTGDQVARPDEAGVLEIVMGDFELTFGRSPVQEGGRPAGFEEDLLAGIDARVTPPQAWITPNAPNRGVTIAVAADSTVTAELVLPEDRVGTWQAGCFIGPGCDPRVGSPAEVTVE